MTSSSDWFARRMGVAPPAQQPAQQPVQQPPAQPLPPVAPLKTTFDKNEGTCPSCGSGNYFSQSRTLHGEQGAWRCYDCGYPIVQTTSGMTGGGEGVPTKAARQPASSVGFMPQATYISSEGGGGQIVSIEKGGQ